MNSKIWKATFPKSTNLLFLIVLVATILHFGSSLFVPLFMGLLVAIVGYPACNRMEKRGMSRPLAIGILLFAVIALFFTLFYLLWYELSLFRQDLPALKKHLQNFTPQLQTWMLKKFALHLDSPDMWTWLLQFAGKEVPIGASIIAFFSFVISAGFTLFMVPVWTALFLYNRERFTMFVYKLAGAAKSSVISGILNETIHTYFRYVIGVAQVYLIVGILNSLGLLALGIKHAFLFGMLTAIMTIIPYLGIIISALLPITVALLTKDSVLYAVGVIGIFAFVQYLEANVIFPKVVAVQLNVSTWATLVGIMTGGIIWGVAGMVLFIPFVAVLKIVSDHFEELAPLNILLKS